MLKQITNISGCKIEPCETQESWFSCCVRNSSSQNYHPNQPVHWVQKLIVSGVCARFGDYLILFKMLPIDQSEIIPRSKFSSKPSSAHKGR